MFRKIFFVVFVSLVIVLLYTSNSTVPVPEVKNARYDNYYNNGPLKVNNLQINSDMFLNGEIRANALKTKLLRVNGSLKAKDLTANSMTINGFFDGKNVASDELYVNGSFEGKVINVNRQFSLSGSMVGENVNVKGDTNLSGEADFKISNFQNVSLRSDRLKLEKTNANNVTFRGTLSKATPKLILEDHSVINGDVVFENGKGEVTMDSSSVIRGQVRGGKIMGRSQK
jgi:cytoskeletal protein CcmA (bactofilin family)